jgi:hypothetical protein
MDGRVLAHYGGQPRLANLQPGRRDALLRRYGGTDIAATAERPG